MNKELRILGNKDFMGIQIPVLEGGFGQDQKVILAKTVAEVHGVETKYINKVINNNMDRFGEHDLINLLSSSEELRNFAQEHGLIGSNRTKDVFLLSERGYTKLVAMMDNNNDKKWEVMDKLIDEYFAMRKLINESEQLKAKLLLSIYKGGQEGVAASKQLSDMETQEAVKPLIATIEEQAPKVEYHDSVLNQQRLLTTTIIAKDIGMSCVKLNEILHEEKVIYKSGKIWTVYANYQHLIPEYCDYHTSQQGYTHLKWTEKGREFIYNLLKENGYIE